MKVVNISEQLMLLVIFWSSLEVITWITVVWYGSIVVAAFVLVFFFFFLFFFPPSLKYICFINTPLKMVQWVTEIRPINNGINTVSSSCSCTKCSGAHQRAHPCSPTALYPGWSAVSNSLSQHSPATTPHHWHETYNHEWNRRCWAREAALNLQRVGFLSGFSQNQ